MAYEFTFPDLGEGITEGELLAWKVSEGDLVAADQTLAEMETDKAVVELPSPRAGRIARLHATEGDIVPVGSVLVTIEETAAAGAGAPAAPRTSAAMADSAAAGAGAGAPPAATAFAPAAGTPPATRAFAPGAGPDGAETSPEPEPYTGSVVGRLEEAPEEPEEEEMRGGTAAAAPAPATSGGLRPAAPPPASAGVEGKVLAMPSVRALAKELGVDLAGIRGTGPGGQILKQDVEDVAQAAAYGIAAPTAISGAGAGPGRAPAAAAAPAAGPPGGPAAETGEIMPLMGGVLETDAFGPVERLAFRGVRRTMAKHMTESVAKQAQVTTMDEADVTVIKRIREKERTVAAERGVRLTFLAFAIKACTAALKRFPRLNAVLDESGDEFVLKRYYNIGIAVDTASGLLVPNIKAADAKSIFQIAAEIVDLVDRADQRRLELHELHGGTFTITNYGAIGGTFATPIINYPEVAILGMGRVREVPVVREGAVVSRLMLPLSLTFDHRLIDGAEAARFLNLVIGYLEDPDLLLLEGA